VADGPPSERAPRDPAHPLKGARIVVGVAGGIAAYKAAELVRMFDKAGAGTMRMRLSTSANHDSSFVIDQEPTVRTRPARQRR
jgi:hypothetical protein